MGPSASPTSSSFSPSDSSHQTPFSDTDSTPTASSSSEGTAVDMADVNLATHDTSQLLAGMDSMNSNIPGPHELSSENLLALGTNNCNPPLHPCQFRYLAGTSNAGTSNTEAGISEDTTSWVSIRVCRSCATGNMSKEVTEACNHHVGELDYSSSPNPDSTTVLADGGEGGPQLGHGADPPFGLLESDLPPALRSDASTRATMGDDETEVSFGSHGQLRSRRG